MEADYLAAVDDSGGIEPLTTWDGTPIPGDHPLTVLALGIIKKEALPEFEDQWNNLRSDIQVAIRCEYLPPIHMRIMWGKDLKKTYRGGPNPYLGAEFGQIKEWYSRAFDILRDFTRRPRTMGFWTFNEARSEAAKVHTRYFQTPEFLAEMLFIRQHSRGPRLKKLYKGYHNRLTSPLLPLFSAALPYINEEMNVCGRKNADVLVDPFGDAHGVDAEAVIKTVTDLNKLSRIASIQKVENADNQPLCQAVDVLGFSIFRRRMAQAQHIKPDIPMEEISTARPMGSLSTAKINHIIDRKYPDLPKRQMTIHYAIAREHLQNIDPNFTKRHLIDVEEFFMRVQALQPSDIGVSILKDASVCADILARLKNDEDHG